MEEFPRKAVYYRVEKPTREVVQYNKLDILKKGRITGWLIRLLIKLKILAYAKHTVDLDPTYNEISFDMDMLVKQYAQELYYLRYYKHQQISMIMLGRDQWEVIKYAKAPDDMLTIQIGAEGIPYMLAGARIVINPFMDGVVFVPESVLKF